jgi:hypothetical protein
MTAIELSSIINIINLNYDELKNLLLNLVIWAANTYSSRPISKMNAYCSEPSCSDGNLITKKFDAVAYPLFLCIDIINNTRRYHHSTITLTLLRCLKRNANQQ